LFFLLRETISTLPLIIALFGGKVKEGGRSFLLVSDDQILFWIIPPITTLGEIRS